MPVSAANLAGEYFVVTGSGKFMRNVILAPQNNLCILEINEAGDAWRIVWGLETGGVPTSEFPSHFLNHSVRKEVTGGACRVIYHAHPANIIAMTFILPLTARAVSRARWQRMSACPVGVPGGVGVVPWMVPGGAAIARETSALMREYDAAVWAHHGLFVSGRPGYGLRADAHHREGRRDLHEGSLLRHALPADHSRRGFADRPAPSTFRCARNFWTRPGTTADKAAPARPKSAPLSDRPLS
jgi:ribulose-5-phosphate 4-epimerase/fuculose-1-phosphate aldolase